MNGKKAQGLSLNAMAIAALVLIVVVVVILIFYDGAKIIPDFIGGQQKCEARNDGNCVSDLSDCSEGNYFSSLKCEGNGYCCITG